MSINQSMFVLRPPCLENITMVMEDWFESRLSLSHRGCLVRKREELNRTRQMRCISLSDPLWYFHSGRDLWSRYLSGQDEVQESSVRRGERGIIPPFTIPLFWNSLHLRMFEAGSHPRRGEERQFNGRIDLTFSRAWPNSPSHVQELSMSTLPRAILIQSNSSSTSQIAISIWGPPWKEISSSKVPV
jgi:hypothetical protein